MNWFITRLRESDSGDVRALPRWMLAMTAAWFVWSNHDAVLDQLKFARRDIKLDERTIILQPEAVCFFKTVCGERGAEEPLLRRGDGDRWSRSHQQRRMATALQRAGLDQDGTFYALRHSYISRAIEGEVPLNIIAENCGTSVRIIETTYAKVLAGKRRDFIERGAPTLMKAKAQ
jgi:integrase